MTDMARRKITPRHPLWKPLLAILQRVEQIKRRAGDQ